MQLNGIPLLCTCDMQLNKVESESDYLNNVVESQQSHCDRNCVPLQFIMQGTVWKWTWYSISLPLSSDVTDWSYLSDSRHLCMLPLADDRLRHSGEKNLVYSLLEVFNMLESFT